MAFLSTGLVASAGSLFYSTTHVSAAQAGSAIGISVMPGAVAKRAMMAPSASATRTRTAGKGALEVSIAKSPGHDDSAWLQQLDIDGDGDVEDTNLVWDDEDKVLYAFSTGTFSCRNGGTAMADLLVAANGPGNPRNRPVGSGFWVADLDKGECAAEAGLWGCRFDESGNATPGWRDRLKKRRPGILRGPIDLGIRDSWPATDESQFVNAPLTLVETISPIFLSSFRIPRFVEHVADKSMESTFCRQHHLCG
jgi:hypothetical protein